MKNKFMRIAAVMLMLCLVTTCAISGTFAKYTTDNTAGDSARVAKWGVTISYPTDAPANSTFASEYKEEDDKFTAATNSVVGLDGTDPDDVVAPGTTGTLAVPVISGTPEVAVRVTIAAKLTLSNWNVPKTSGEGTEEYCPLIFKVGTETFKIGENGIADITGLIAAVEEKIAGYSADYEANTDLKTDANTLPTVTWTWEFVGDDAKDTALGDAAVNGTAATIKLDLTVTVTQIN